MVRETEVRTLQAALDEKTQDLLERVVMAGLVRNSRGRFATLRKRSAGSTALRRILPSDRVGSSSPSKSGRSIAASWSCSSEESILQPAVREELRDFFQARLDEFKRSREGDVPDVLDYRPVSTTSSSCRAGRTEKRPNFPGSVSGLVRAASRPFHISPGDRRGVASVQ